MEEDKKWGTFILDSNCKGRFSFFSHNASSELLSLAFLVLRQCVSVPSLLTVSVLSACRISASTFSTSVDDILLVFVILLMNITLIFFNILIFAFQTAF